MASDKFIRLHLVDKSTVDILLEEYSRGGGGMPGFGEPEHVFSLAKRKGYFAINSRDNQASGLNGGCGDVQIPVSSVVRSEVLSFRGQVIQNVLGPLDVDKASSLLERTVTLEATLMEQAGLCTCGSSVNHAPWCAYQRQRYKARTARFEEWYGRRFPNGFSVDSNYLREAFEAGANFSEK